MEEDKTWIRCEGCKGFTRIIDLQTLVEDDGEESNYCIGCVSDIIDKERDTYPEDIKKIYGRFGYLTQVDKTLEELDEFKEALYRMMREAYNERTSFNGLPLNIAMKGREDLKWFFEELADVEIMIDQLKMIHTNNATWQPWYEKLKRAKVERTLKRIEDGYYDEDK